MTMDDLLGESASLSATAASACFVTRCSVDEADGDVAESGILGGCTGKACIVALCPCAAALEFEFDCVEIVVSGVLDFSK